MLTKEEVREILAIHSEPTIEAMIGCNECPYQRECANYGHYCYDTLKHYNHEYIQSLSKNQKEEENAILPNNMIQITPQGEIKGLGSLSLEDLAKLSTAARDMFERKTVEHEEELWCNVVNAVKEYCQAFGNIDFVFMSESDEEEHVITFDHSFMTDRGEINCCE